jgi:hypothetical protein
MPGFKHQARYCAARCEQRSHKCFYLTYVCLCVCSAAAAAVVGWSWQAILSATTGDGHRAAVHSLVVPPASQYMFSGDRSGVIKVGSYAVQYIPFMFPSLRNR